MQIYLVGGAVRNKLLNLAVKDKDWVVVGTTPQALIDKGFVPIGKDFPVFLHPKTKEEYALARTERKSGRGYHGFTFYTAPVVTIEDDLLRRDLTINAIAEDQDNQLIDPCNGINDIKNRVLRHVSSAFIEDPVRLLRIARFRAELANFHFSIAPETMELLKNMVANGEIDHLVAERVWSELVKSLHSASPESFFNTLIECQAINIIMPEITEIVTNEFLDYLQKTSKTTTNSLIRFASMFIGSNNNLTTKYKLLTKLINRLKIPKNFSEIAKMALNHSYKLCSNQLAADELEYCLDKCDAFRRPERFMLVLQACKPITTKNHLDKITQAITDCAQISTKDIIAKGYQGKSIKKQISLQRIIIINKIFH